LCKAYWFPVYSFLRGQGADSERAADLTQSFFEYLIERREIGRATPERGRFRSFLRTAAKYFYWNALDHERRAVRGGDLVKLSIDVPGAEERLAATLSCVLSPEQLFDRAWAAVVTERAALRFEECCEDPADLALLREVRSRLAGEVDACRPSPKAAASVKERVSRFRQRERVIERYRRCLRREIMGTVDDSSAVDDEIRSLLDC
jgi:RNA polymerase sigma-70 factor (ECF subfamily)